MFVFRIVNHQAGLPHDHVFHEIVYIEAGSVEHQTAAGVRTLRPGDIIVLRPQEWHAYQQPRHLTLVNCLIDSRLMHRLGPLFGQVTGAFELLRRRTAAPWSNPPTVLHATPAQRGVVQARLQAIMVEQHNRTDGWQAAATAAMLDLLICIARIAQGQRPLPAGDPAPGDRAQQAVIEVASYLESRFKDPVALDDLAAMVHLSPAYLSRCFSQHMGIGIIQYLHRMRIEEACRLLRHTKEPIGRIATMVGYDEIAYFSRCFRAQMRQSPLQYRQAVSRDAPDPGLRQLAASTHAADG